MKTTVHRGLIRPVLLIGTMAVAYVVGRSHGSNAVTAKDMAAARVPGRKSAIAQNPANDSQAAAANQATLEPTAALAELAQLAPGTHAVAAYRRFFEQWVKADPASASDAAVAAAAVPDGPQRTAALIGVATAWALADPQAALEWATTLSVTDADVLKETMMAASRQDPKLAALYLDQLTGPAAQNAAIGAIAKSLAQNDPAGALVWLDQVAVGATYDSALRGIFSNLAQHDPQAGAALLAMLDTQVDRNAAIGQLARSWSGTDPVAALNWVQSLPDSDGAARDAALNAIVGSLSKNDLSAAVAFVYISDDPTLVERVAPTLAQAFAQLDAPAALAWANSLPASPARDQSLSNVLVTLGQTDFPTAWGEATNLPGGSGRDGAMGSLVSSLAKKDPGQAAKLLPEFETETASLNATRAVAANWVKQNPRDLSMWVNTLPPGNQRDAAVAQMVTAQAAQDPATALAWATTIADPRTRNTQMLSTVKKWSNVDPTAAASAVQSLTNIPDNQRATMMINVIKTKGAGN